MYKATMANGMESYEYDEKDKAGAIDHLAKHESRCADAIRDIERMLETVPAGAIDGLNTAILGLEQELETAEAWRLNLEAMLKGEKDAKGR